MERRMDVAARRDYWIEQMEAAGRFMDVMTDFPVDECAEALVPLRDAVACGGVEVTFSPTQCGGCFDRLFYLREGLLPAFLSAAQEMNERGWVLRVEDAYRTRAMQKALGLMDGTFDAVLALTMWELDGETPTPELMLRRLTAVVATTPKIGTHMSGSAIDISVSTTCTARRVCDGGRADQEAREPLDRGAPYLEMSERTPMGSPFVSQEAQRNRREITSLLARHGFAAYPYEFWHYSSGDAYEAYVSGGSGPARYGPVDLDCDTGEVVPIEEATALLTDIEEIEARIDECLARGDQAKG